MSRRFKCIDSISKKGQLILTIVIGLLIGTIFVFGSLYWYSEVNRTDCIQSHPQYESHKFNYHRTTINEIIIYFSNDEILVIDDVSINDELTTEIDKLNSNSNIIVLYHPNSNTILEMIVNGKVLLDFDTTITRIVNERNGFIFLGCIMYLFAFISMVELTKMRKKK